MKDFGLPTNQKETKCLNLQKWTSALTEGKKLSNKSQAHFVQEKGLLKPAKIVKLSVFCTKRKKSH